MRIKLIISLIAFIATFGSSFLLTELVVGKQTPRNIGFTRQFDRQIQEKILALLRRDIRNGAERDQQIDWTKGAGQQFSFVRTMIQNAEATSEYADKSGSIDDSDLPAEFQLAWQAHMSAWREHADFLEEMKIASEDAEFDFSETIEIYKSQNREISRTWYEVLHIGRNHGAIVPSQIY